MKFRYVDLQLLGVVGAFENSHGNMHFWSERQIKKNLKKFKEIGDWDAAVECHEALETIRDFKECRKPWWQIW